MGFERGPQLHRILLLIVKSEMWQIASTRKVVRNTTSKKARDAVTGCETPSQRVAATKKKLTLRKSYVVIDDLVKKGLINTSAGTTIWSWLLYLYHTTNAPQAAPIVQGKFYE